MLSVLSSTSCDNPFLSIESFVITELIITELSFKFAKLQNSEYEYGLDHVGGTRCCESNAKHFADKQAVQKKDEWR